MKALRATVEAIKHRVPKAVAARHAIFGGVPGEWLSPSAGSRRGTLLYLHGGGYFAGSARTHRPITTAFARRGLDVFVPEYRLAPEHPFPAAIEDAVAAYRGLLASGIAPEHLSIAGDSAGGGLAMAALLTLRDAGEPLPATCALFSPWTDLAGTGASLVINDERDAVCSGDGIHRTAARYLAEAEPYTPLASPVYAALHGLPPTLIHVGNDEVLLDDSVRLADRARAAGTPITLQIWRVVPHVCQLFTFVPEARVSIDGATAFLLAAMEAPARLAV